MTSAALLVILWALQSAPAQKATPTPPCSTPEHRQFDFWIGEWDVVTPSGKPAGRNSITREFGGCVLQERWQGAGGNEGGSFNIYSATSRTWHQTWVDSSGLLLTLTGSFKDNAMTMTGVGGGPKGTSLNRITWTALPDDQVRQKWETSADDGKTWTVVFEGLYRRRG